MSSRTRRDTRSASSSARRLDDADVRLQLRGHLADIGQVMDKVLPVVLPGREVRHPAIGVAGIGGDLIGIGVVRDVLVHQEVLGLEHLDVGGGGQDEEARPGSPDV